ncbi:hypothetical protein F3Y22_tig00110236pilonHSYRG00040 [Hibiscus syriacus]|uniref:AB hydrolase-1 domain-containing protein n=1 Tax=Hibiscus syriacus TaxID=106335 RepID=A0A6A3BAL1_HIBSY|nr:hypothetical protein F3Y22_tig00110236pilonHSYRG00040 [Hibiscus syriacus]
MSETSEKIHFVMVHGFGHGAWCWYKIRSLLEASGYKVSCIDLKGSGIDPSDPNTIFTFQDYNEPLINLLSNLPQNQKVILVGHSAGGHSLTYAMRKFVNKILPARIAIDVNLARLPVALACVEAHQSRGTVNRPEKIRGDLDLSVYGDVNEKIYGLGADQPTTSMIIKEEFQRKILYHLSSIEEAMLKRWPPSLVFALESDHIPFFSTPTHLFAFLLKAVASVNAAT